MRTRRRSMPPCFDLSTTHTITSSILLLTGLCSSSILPLLPPLLPLLLPLLPLLPLLSLLLPLLLLLLLLPLPPPLLLLLPPPLLPPPLLPLWSRLASFSLRLACPPPLCALTAVRVCMRPRAAPYICAYTASFLSQRPFCLSVRAHRAALGSPCECQMPSDTPLHDAAFEGDLAAVRLLLAEGSDVNAKEDIVCPNCLSSSVYYVLVVHLSLVHLFHLIIPLPVPFALPLSLCLPRNPSLSIPTLPLAPLPPLSLTYRYDVMCVAVPKHPSPQCVSQRPRFGGGGTAAGRCKHGGEGQGRQEPARLGTYERHE